MSCLSVKTIMAFMLACLACSRIAADNGLHLKSYSEGGVKGCYKHSEALGVCFDVKQDSMKIQSKTTGEGIVHYLEIGQDISLYQILDQAFIGHGPSMFHVPDDVPIEPQALRAFVKDKTEDGIEQFKALKSHYQAAMRKLHYVPEVQLLERVSAALGDNSTRLEILQPFHALCFDLLKKSEVEIPAELRAAPDPEEETADQHTEEKRCFRPTLNRCQGLCGLGCRCWSWFCGDCCWHRGCYEHDICCNKYGRYTSYCVVPIKYGFNCQKFGGYPACKKNSSGWRRK